MVDFVDIQFIEVLKDVLVVVIYGFCVVNGVVLVIIKGGCLEIFVCVIVDVYIGVQMVVKYIDVMDGNQFCDLVKVIGYSLVEGLLNWNGGVGIDWQKEFYNLVMVSKVSLNVFGGNKILIYNFLGSYFNQDGIVNIIGYEVWNICFKNIFFFFNNYLCMGIMLMMKFYKKKYEDVLYIFVLIVVFMWNVYGEDGIWGVVLEWIRGDNFVGWIEVYDY